MEDDAVYRTRVVEFLGRPTPIILQNDNGPSPLIAICNVLLLRDAIQLSPDASQVSQQTLLTHVADRLIDCSASGYQDNDEGSATAQVWNILPCLATGLKVNVHFQKIDDFEPSPECSIFGLLGIHIYHGCILDPKDTDTAQVIGSKSYKTSAKSEAPLLSLSSGRSLDDHPSPEGQGRGKSDREELELLEKIKELSKIEASSKRGTDQSNLSLNLKEGDPYFSFASETCTSLASENGEPEESHQLTPIENTPSSQGKVDDLAVFSSPAAPCTDLSSLVVLKESSDAFKKVIFHSASIMDEGENCKLDLTIPKYESHEDEMALAEEANQENEDAAHLNSNDMVSRQDLGQLTKKSLENQLTGYGLSCLKEDVGDRELCVFFRNNHFSTMFKFNGELYLLVTDQGYLNQPDIVWETLHEDNGNTVFMTGNFKKSKANTHVDDWNKKKAVISTAEDLGALQSSASASSTLSTDQQLAAELQELGFKESETPASAPTQRRPPLQ